MQDFNGTDIGITVGAAGAGGWLLKWVWERIWKHRDTAAAEEKKAEADHRTRVERMISGLGEKFDTELRSMRTQMDNNFTEIRTMMNVRDVNVAKLEAAVGFIEKQVESLQREMSLVTGRAAPPRVIVPPPPDDKS